MQELGSLLRERNPSSRRLFSPFMSSSERQEAVGDIAKREDLREQLTEEEGSSLIREDFGSTFWDLLPLPVVTLATPSSPGDIGVIVVTAARAAVSATTNAPPSPAPPELMITGPREEEETDESQLTIWPFWRCMETCLALPLVFGLLLASEELLLPAPSPKPLLEEGELKASWMAAILEAIVVGILLPFFSFRSCRVWKILSSSPW